MKFLKCNFGVALLALVLVFNACKPTDDEPFQDYSSGVFITCEGKASGVSGTVDFYSRTIGDIQNDIYGKQNNGASIGNGLQSMTVHNDTAFLVANSSNKIALVNYKTFKSLGSYEGLKSPRNFLYLTSAFSYITEWGTDGLTGGVSVFDQATKKVIKTITVGKGAEQMLLSGTTVYAINSGGLGKDSTVTIINSNVDTVYSNITVGTNPNSIVQDINGDLWVLCSGSTSTGKLMKIRNLRVEYSFDVPLNARSLTTNKDKSILYFVIGNKIYQKDLFNFGANPPSVFLTAPYLSNSYGVGVDPKTGYIYCADAKDSNSAGKVYIYNPTTKAVIDSVKTGVIPSHFYFY